MLDEAVVALALQQIWHSRASVASGLRAWGGFAEQVLGYEPSATLPPRSTSDAQRFVVVFRNGGTAYNYLLYVVWACRFHLLSTAWWSPELKLTLSGAKKKSRDLLDLSQETSLTLLTTVLLE